MAFMKFLGGRPDATPAPVEAETEAVRKIVARLEAMPPEQARLLAGMGYLLSRAANSDLAISDAETAAIEGFLADAGLDRAQAALVTEMAKMQERTTGGTSDYLVTREFRQLSTPDQKAAVLRGCYLVAAADSGISSMEISVLRQIADELDIEKDVADAIRAEFADSISARFLAPDGSARGPAEGS
jgi:uncharacterized tellurite resistance protein B-like protein